MVVTYACLKAIPEDDERRMVEGFEPIEDIPVDYSDVLEIFGIVTQIGMKHRQPLMSISQQWTGSSTTTTSR